MLDTSGVGDIQKLLPVLVANHVHVRVSLDTVSDTNDRLRPPNRSYVTGKDISRKGAEHTIKSCLKAGLNVTVQTVISAGNEHESEWNDLKEWLIARGVRHWVLHVAVKGGSARRIENEAQKKSRPRGILPGPEVYQKLWRLVQSTQSDKSPLDIRCTDTNQSPNSVLLVGSKGDLYTEGYARNGKVLLYSAGDNRPDLIGALWPHIDRFGHAKRYLNWNPWFYEGSSIETICFNVPIPPTSTSRDDLGIVETESKYKVEDLKLLKRILSAWRFKPGSSLMQRDEYFDTKQFTYSSLNNVVRLRYEGSSLKFCHKGPLARAADGKYSRIELEIDAAKTARRELEAKGMILTWFFEKRRVEYRRADLPIVVALDEIPEFGHYVEIEGPPSSSRDIEQALRPALGEPETRNYKDLFVALKEQQGVNTSTIKGAAFRSTAKKKP